MAYVPDNSHTRAHARRSSFRQALHRLISRHWRNWHVIICIALAVMTVVETIGFMIYGIVSAKPAVALCLTSALTVALLPRLPRITPWFLLILYALGDISALTMPSAMFLSALFSIAWLTYHSAWRGFIGALIPVTASMTVILSEGGYIPWIIASTTQYACWYFSFMGVGLWVRKTRAYELLKNQQQQRRLSEQLQMHLHDSAANDLAYALTMIDLRTSNGDADHAQDRETLLAVRDACEDALQQVRRAIDVVRDSDGTVMDFSDTATNTATNVDSSDWLHQIRIMIDDCERQLQELGFRGTGIVSGEGHTTPSNDSRDMIISFIHEIYGNILKHADPKEYHIVAIQPMPNGVVISSSNIRRHKGFGPSACDQGGTGLQRYERQLAQVGGTLDILEDDNEWSITALIPYCQSGQHTGGSQML
ncbi:hypothetical protein BTIS_0862 [Bifidobacterium tissieri]|uniref:Signal transduction histidine kinase subgroup 3 dimerisation and phosphoacceptor domain-containing protein n=1 Tax=Bifidobacterium tissieri TaxID=1630162 RepID=A0A261FHP4_9BIFI|nr:histidine kinase [Bifidobacterium tissieri]OZG58493.1 hypothetical protein BTIS_0862 [Bifidobacterium tissieri]